MILLNRTVFENVFDPKKTTKDMSLVCELIISVFLDLGVAGVVPTATA